MNIFQECINDDFLTQVINQPKRGDALLDFILAKKEQLVRGAVI